MQSPETQREESEAATTSSPDRPVPPRRLGAWLRAERLRRSESLAEVERDIHVTRAYLEAIEEEHFDVLPAPVYTRGFVRLYARRLGLDAAEAVALLPADLPIPPGLEPSAALRRPGREAPAISLPRVPSMRVPALRIPEMRTPRGGFRLPSLPSLPARRGPDGAAEAAGPGVDTRRWGLAALGVVVLILSAVYLPRAFDGAGSSATATPTAAAATAQATVQAGGTPSGGGTSSGAAPQPTAAASGAAPAGGITVPNLGGVARADAQARLQDAGLTSVVVEIASATVPAGQVASQQPAAGTSVGRGENVTLIVSRGAPRN